MRAESGGRKLTCGALGRGIGSRLTMGFSPVGGEAKAGLGGRWPAGPRGVVLGRLGRPTCARELGRPALGWRSWRAGPGGEGPRLGRWRCGPGATRLRLGSPRELGWALRGCARARPWSTRGERACRRLVREAGEQEAGVAALRIPAARQQRRAEEAMGRRSRSDPDGSGPGELIPRGGGAGRHRITWRRRPAGRERK